METKIKTITDFLNKEYLDYSQATIQERAIPSLCDGFKPGARKIMHAANEGTIKDGKTYKLLVLSGDTMNKSQFAHGDASLNATIAEKSKDFVNNLNAIEIEGQGGSLRNPDAVGSPRYLYIRKSKYMDMIYKMDYDLLDFVFDEGMYLEPQQYYPIIPTVLTSLAMGIANGYAFHSMAYNPLNIIDICIEELKNSDHKTMLVPYLRGVDPDTWKYGAAGIWYSYGKWKFNQSKDLMSIIDLPYDVTYEDFEKLLNKLEDNGTIRDYKNLSEDGKVHYDVWFQPRQLTQNLQKDKTGLMIANKFKLIKQVPSDLLWVLDENHKLKYFDTPYSLIKYFINWRLSIYTLRKKKLVKILEEKYKNNSDLVKFIELICNGKLKIRNRSKADIKADMDIEKLPISLISTPMSKVTIEERDALLKENEEIRKELEYIRNSTEKQMYLDDLKKLRDDLKKDFPDNNIINKVSEVKVEVEGKERITKEEKELIKVKKEKDKEKKQKEKDKANKQKEKDKKLKEKEKQLKEKDKQRYLKIKEKITKYQDEYTKYKAICERARLCGAKDKALEYKQKCLDIKDKIKELKEQL